jgi:nucleotide-binding universal stress UspA family protein
MLKILIAVDGSDHANHAIEAVAKMRRNSLELEATLLCVSPEPLFYGDYTASTIRHIKEDQKQQQDTVLEEATRRAEELGLPLAAPARAYGVIPNEIIRVAEQRQVDQIAMGTRGMGALGAAVLGSVAQRVLHLSQVPVLLSK